VKFLQLSGFLTLVGAIAGCSSGGGGNNTAQPIQLTFGQVVGRAAYPMGDTATGGSGQTVDAIGCDNSAVVYHVHAHLSLFVNGEQIAIPLGIGIPNPTQFSSTVVDSGSCFYFLHTHDSSGIIHVEAPAPGTFTLGQFFDIWGEPLTPTNVAGNMGAVTIVVDGAQYTGDPRAIELTAHKQITLIVGTAPASIPTYLFPAGY
jgi:hypothetical protein